MSKQPRPTEGRTGSGHGPSPIAGRRYQNASTDATLHERKWHISNLRDILTRPTYRGRHFYGVHDTRNGIKRPEEEWQEIPAPVIIPEAEWLEV